MKVNTAILFFNEIKLPARMAPKIRGYIAERYPEFTELHHHDGKKMIYKYPLIQYKIVNDIPIIIGINEGIDILKIIFMDLEKLELGNLKFDINEKFIDLSNGTWGIAPKMLHYSFINPWMALNQKNYPQYANGDQAAKKDILKRILTGNILSVSKSLNYTVEEHIQAAVDLKPIEVNFKNKTMIAFVGNFSVNFHIPELWGLGKSVSRGFGAVIGNRMES